MILLNPGPVNLSPGVRAALSLPDLCHREPEFAELQACIRAGLLEAYGLSHQRWAAVLLTGSGTAAVEAMITSLVPKTGYLLVIDNGVYGERMSRIAQLHNIEYYALRYAWGDGARTAEVAAFLDKQPKVSHVALVHHETTTGRLNKLGEIGKLCAARGIGVLLDAVSSFGAEQIDFEGCAIVGCAATANKCLHGVPGVSFVVAQREKLNAPNCTPRTLYLDLAAYCREQDQGGTPFTQSVQAFYALAAALDEFKEQGGLAQRQERYRQLSQQLRAGLSQRGLHALLKEDECSVVLSAFRLPKGLGYEQLHDRLKERGFVIYAGQGRFAREIFRISTMGEITRDDIERLLDAIGEIVRIPN
ncbi:MAG: 2-aminoethylphosphonate aminotransferase [Burkholderiales bacterium]